MTLKQFEAMIAPGGYQLERRYDSVDGRMRYIYTSSRGGPKLNVPVTRTDHGEFVDDWEALKIEVLLDEEDFFDEGE
jgi:hypothetical protein